MNKEEFKEYLNNLNININDEIMNQLDTYYKYLVEYNSHTNLTAITEEKDVYLKHFYDSLTIVKVINLNENLKICDIGTGAGFPGIPIKILNPECNIVLLDSLNKRINFLNAVKDELCLKNIELILNI